MINRNEPSKRGIPPLALNADGDIIINITQNHPYASGPDGPVSIDPDLYIIPAPKIDGTRIINTRRLILVVGYTKLSNSQLKAFNEQWAPLEVRSVMYGNAIYGLRAHVVLVLDQPRTGRDSDWLNTDARMRLVPDGLWLEGPR